MPIKLITFSTNNFYNNAVSLQKSALDVGFDEAIIFTPDDFKSSDFYQKNKKILDQKRGAGYWLWKPYFIQKCLKKARKNDILFYCDAGRNKYYQFNEIPTRLINKVKANNKGVLLGATIPHLGPIRNWTKRDCLLLLDADHNYILDKSPLMTWSLWRPTSFAFTFVEKWLNACCDARCLTDMPNTLGKPNYPEFKDHRHDQAILSILAYQQNAPYLDFSDTIIQKLINLRPNSLIAHTFYKRPENVDALLGGAGIAFLLKQHLAIKSASAQESIS